MTKEEMFNDNVKIAYKIANKYKINYLHEFEDIKQVALLGLWKAVKNYNGNYAFSTFAYRVIENEINYYLRKVKKQKLDISMNTPLNEDLTIEDMLADELVIEDVFEKIEIQETLSQILSTIPEKNREVYKLLTQGYKQQGIAKKFNISQGQVSRIQKDVIKKVRDSL